MSPVLIESERSNITLKGVDLQSVRKLLPKSLDLMIEATEDVIFVSCQTENRMRETLSRLQTSFRGAGYCVNPGNVIPSYVIIEGECFRIQ